MECLFLNGKCGYDFLKGICLNFKDNYFEKVFGSFFSTLSVKIIAYRFAFVIFSVIFSSTLSVAADPDSGPVLAAGKKADAAAQGADCSNQQPEEKKKKCDECARKLKESGKKTKDAATKMDEDFNAANASKINSSGGDTQVDGAGGAGKTACDGAKAAGDKLGSSGLKDMLNDQCEKPSECDGTDAARNADDYKESCDQAKKGAKSAQKKQQGVQSKTSSMCKQDKNDEKNEGKPPEDKKDDGKPPEIPPMKPPEDKPEEKKPEEPPKKEAPPSGISMAEKTGGTPAFDKKEPKLEIKPEPRDSGRSAGGLSKNESDASKSNFIPGVFNAAISKVDGGGGGGGGNGSGSSREGKATGDDKSKTRDSEAASSIDIGGGHLFKGGKPYVYGVTAKGDEFDDLKKDIESGSKKTDSKGSSVEAGVALPTSNKGSGVGDEAGNLFQVVHQEYFHLWKAGKL